ncbi:MAG: response regulator [Actinomycetota bacterium]|nr:response regulator [Actinomycetota bacterium]
MPPVAPLDVLVVEDDANDAELAEDYVRRAPRPVDVRHARTLAQAADEAHARSFDVVVLDLGLPDAHGTVPVEVMREADGDSAIVVLSATADEPTVLACFAAGAEDFVPKRSVAPGILAGAVVRGAARHDARRRRIAAQLDVIASPVAGGGDHGGWGASRHDQLVELAGALTGLVDQLGARTHLYGEPEIDRSLGELVAELGRRGMGLDEVMTIHALAVGHERAERGDMAAYARLATGRALLLRLVAGLLEHYRLEAGER